MDMMLLQKMRKRILLVCHVPEKREYDLMLGLPIATACSEQLNDS